MQVTLSDGTVIEIDEEDLPLLQEADWRRDTKSQSCRIASFSGAVRRNGRRYHSLARLIAEVPACSTIHYHNQNPLDLRRANLWFHPQFRASAGTTSRVVGVAFNPEPVSPDEGMAKRFYTRAPESPKTGTEAENAPPPAPRRTQNKIPRWWVGTSKR